MFNLKQRSKKFLILLRKNIVFYLVLFFTSSAFLFSVSLGTTVIDKQVENEITQEITNQAITSKFKFSLNSITMEEKGNSDYWIFTSNKLQDFQMQNQTKIKNKNYIFSMYKATEKYTPFKYLNYSCSTILFESKYQDNKFYFDLPLISGTLPRYIDKNSIYITDKFAQIIAPDKKPSELIGKALDGEIITSRKNSNITYKINGVFGTDNNLGNFLNNFFGNNLIFVTEHNIVPMTNELYFCGCTDKNSNNAMVNFVTENYKDSSGSSGGLEIGYKANYKFYELNETSQQILGNLNIKLNNIINLYKNNGIMLTLFGCVLAFLMLIFIIMMLKREKLRYVKHGKGYVLFSFWLISCFSLIIISLLFNYLPLTSLICRQSFITRSAVTSSGILLAWLLLTLIFSIFPFTKINSIKHHTD